MKQIFTTLFIFSLLTSLFTLQSHAATPPAPVPQTGQTLCYDATGFTIVCAGTGQDGDIKAGVASPTLASFQCMSHGNSCCYGLLLSVYIRQPSWKAFVEQEGRIEAINWSLQYSSPT